MDKDQNGMLSLQELGSFGSGMLTDVFIQRVPPPPPKRQLERNLENHSKGASDA